MDDHALFDSLCALVRRVAQVPDETPMTAGTRLVEDLAVDSLDLVSVYLEVQDAYGVSINEEDLPSLGTLGELADYDAQHRTEQAA